MPPHFELLSIGRTLSFFEKGITLFVKSFLCSLRAFKFCFDKGRDFGGLSFGKQIVFAVDTDENIGIVSCHAFGNVKVYVSVFIVISHD